MIEYNREEAIALLDSLLTKLASQVETYSGVNINDCDNLEIAIYLQQYGKEFISLIQGKNIKDELAEYNNETIDMVLSKMLPVAIELGLEKNLSRDFCIVDTPYSTKIYNQSEKGNPENPRAEWTMQNADWGDKWRYISEEKIKESNERLSEALKDLGFSNEKISEFLDTKDSENSSMELLNISFNRIIKEKEELNRKNEELRLSENNEIEREIEEIRANKTLSDQVRKELLRRRNALLLHKTLKLEEYKNQNAKAIEDLKSKMKSLLYDKVYNSGCKIIATAKVFSAMYDDDNITPNTVMQYVDEQGLLDDEGLKSVYPDYKVTTVKGKDIANYVFPKECYIIGHAQIGGGYGYHFVAIKSITTVVKNGKVIIKYEKSNSSNNDETREYSSEDPGDSPKKAKVFELRIFERIKE